MFRRKAFLHWYTGNAAFHIPTYIRYRICAKQCFGSGSELVPHWILCSQQQCFGSGSELDPDSFPSWIHNCWTPKTYSQSRPGKNSSN
jgi:hypothetical protein